MADGVLIERKVHGEGAPSYVIHGTSPNVEVQLKENAALNSGFGASLFSAFATLATLVGMPLAGIFMGAPTLLMSAVVGIGAGFAGSKLGDLFSRREERTAYRDGLEVSPPGIVNRGMLQSAAMGFSLAASLTLAIASIAGIGATTAAMVPIGGLAIAAGVIGTAGALLGGYLGGQSESEKQLLRYHDVQQQFQQQTAQLAPTLARTHTPEAAPDIERGQFTQYAHPEDRFHPAQENTGRPFVELARRGREAARRAEAAVVGDAPASYSGFAARVDALAEAGLPEGLRHS